MIQPRDAVTILDREFLVLRGKILEVAAALDRLDRAPNPADGHAAPDRRLGLIRQALETLLEREPDRAETIQRLFSRDYDPRWIDELRRAQPRFQPD